MGGIQNAGLLGLVAAASAGIWAQSIPELYKKAEQELRTGDVSAAERDFRSVVLKDSASAGAHANLGVVYMRRKLWPQALQELGTAEQLAPAVTGIRLNIGIANFRRGDYGAAIPPLESVLRDEPDSGQAAYLVGVCYFLMNRDADAKAALVPLWEQQSSNLQYLYVLGIAAGNAGDRDLESRSLRRLEKIGDGSPQMHLLKGKAHLARQDEAAALAEFSAAVKGDPKLPFGHYYLGLVKRKAHDLESARAEFLADSTIEADVPFNFEELGNLAAEAGEKQQAEDYLKHALQLEPRLATARYSLAKLYRSESRYGEALAEVDGAARSDDRSASLHYLRAQILQKLDRLPEAKREFAISSELRNQVRDELEVKLSGNGFREAGLEP